jgi:hypothetical protein
MTARATAEMRRNSATSSERLASTSDTVSGNIDCVSVLNPYLVRVIGHRTLSATTTVATPRSRWRTAMTTLHSPSRVSRPDLRACGSVVSVLGCDTVEKAYTRVAATFIAF